MGGHKFLAVCKQEEGWVIQVHTECNMGGGGEIGKKCECN